MWPVTGSYSLSSRCLSWAGTCICVDCVNDGIGADRIADQSAVRSGGKICGGRPAGPGECCVNGLAWSDPVCLVWSNLILPGAWPVQLRTGRWLRRRRVRRHQRRGMASLRGASTASAGLGVACVCVCLWRLCVCGGCVFVGLYGRGICGVCMVVECVGQCRWWIGLRWLDWRGICGNRNAGLGENEVDMAWVCLYGWYINSEEKNFEKGFGKGMAMNLLVHKN